MNPNVIASECKYLPLLLQFHAFDHIDDKIALHSFPVRVAVCLPRKETR